MSSLKTAIRLLKTDSKAFRVRAVARLSGMKISHIIPDKKFLSMQFRALFNRKIDWESPTSFNEKLQWLKVYDRNPEYCQLVDKFEVKKYVAALIGNEYIIPTLGVWDSFDDIDFDQLPDKFVLKCTHDSGSVVICQNKSSFDVDKAREKLEKKLKRNMFWWGREWPYKNVKPRILAEQFMEDDSGELRDYKFMCFNGKVRCAFTCTDRFSGKGLHVTFFDKDWNVMPFERSFPSAKEGVPKPLNYEKMLVLAEKLSADIPFVRVDFYEVGGQIYFGELTFFPGNGMEAFQPEEWDYRLGEWINLPNKEIIKR